MSAATKDEPVDIREQIAVAATTSSLKNHAADVVGAMGAAALVMHYNPETDRSEAKRTPVGTAEISGSRRLALLLDRAKYARDIQAARQLAILFAHDLGKNKRWCDSARIKSGDDLLFRFCAQVVSEWVHDRCRKCGGSGFLSDGEAMRNAKTHECKVCKGKGSAKVDHGARARTLRVAMKTYDHGWSTRFEEAQRRLADIELTLIDPLRSQLKRGTVRPVRK